jgi:hypothetical protein
MLVIVISVMSNTKRCDKGEVIIMPEVMDKTERCYNQLPRCQGSGER